MLEVIGVARQTVTPYMNRRDSASTGKSETIFGKNDAQIQSVRASLRVRMDTTLS